MHLRLLALLALIPLSVASVQFTVEDQSTCSCDFSTFRLFAENQGDVLYEEVLRLESNASVFPKTIDVRLEPGEKKAFTFFGQAVCGGQSISRITISDPKTSLFTTLFGKICDGFLLSVTPAEQTVCQNQHTTYAVHLSNIGRSTQNVTLSTDLNPESYDLAQTLSLPPFKDRNIILTINTPTVPQRLPFKVFAQGDGFEQTQPAILQVKACYGLAIEGPESITLSANQSTALSFSIRNLGSTRGVHIESFCPDFVVKKDVTALVNATGTYLFSLDVKNALPGAYTCSIFATAQGESRSYSQTVRIEVERQHTSNGTNIVNNRTGDLDAVQKTARIEQNLETPIEFRIENFGIPKTINARLRLPNSQILTLSRNVTLAKGTNVYLSFIVRSNMLGRLNGSLLLNETEYPFTLEVVTSKLTVEGTTYKTSTGLRVDLRVTNFGNPTRIDIFSNPATLGPVFLELPENAQGRASYFLNTTEPVLIFSMKTNRGSYQFAQTLSNPQPLPQTGLLTLTTPVLAFAIAVLLALGLLYLSYRRSRG